MAVYNNPNTGPEINGPLVTKFAEIDAFMSGGGSTSLLTEAENKGYIQRRNVFTSPVQDSLAIFFDKLKKHKGKDENQGDINVVMVDGSVSTDMDYASERADAPYRPPMSTEMNLPSMIQEKLHYKEQQYRRWDAFQESTSNTTPNFTEITTGGSATTVIQDPAWDWQYGSPQPQSWRNRLTRILTGTTPSTSFLFRNSYRRCDFLYSTDYVSSNALVVTIAGGNGFVQVYDDRPGSGTIGTWVEANGYVFSSREDPLTEGAIRTPGFTFNSTANGPSTTVRKSVYQKRLKIRRTDISSSRNITITASDGARLCYWGIQYSTNDFMFNFINSARGSHNIQALRVFEEWDVDYWKPDLILYSCNTINEMISSAGGIAVADVPSTFSNRFQTYINALLTKTYKPEIFAFMLFINMNQQPIDHTGRYLVRTGSSGLGGNGYTLEDYLNYLFATLKSITYPSGYDAKLIGKPIASANVFQDAMRYGIRRNADTPGSSVFQELFGYTQASGGTSVVGKTGRTGTALVGDGTHPNDMGAFLFWRYLEKYLEY